VFHDDQHGTAIVVLAALRNALKVIKKNLEDVRIVINGSGSAGAAIAKLIHAVGGQHIVVCDRAGAIYAGRGGLNSLKEWIAANTNAEKQSGSLSEVIAGANVFIGVSSANVLNAADVQKMGEGRIVCALANPDPEITPQEAGPHVDVMATGRSDYANQINNVLCFPGFFRGMLDVRARGVSESMKIAAADAIAGVISENEIHPDYIIPSVFDRRVSRAVAAAVAQAAIESKLAKKDAR
jgi:malate dehydrogenase (oxaloacetate-decarboxylating)